eukprot:360467-Chlamydomonas_euryale.AAC.2
MPKWEVTEHEKERETRWQGYPAGAPAFQTCEGTPVAGAAAAHSSAASSATTPAATISSASGPTAAAAARAPPPSASSLAAASAPPPFRDNASVPLATAALPRAAYPWSRYHCTASSSEWRSGQKPRSRFARPIRNQCVMAVLFSSDLREGHQTV